MCIIHRLKKNMGYDLKINDLGFELLILIFTFAALLEEDY